MMITQNLILLQGMKFYACHGVLEQERILGNHFLIDLELYLDFSKAAESDCLNDTVSYADIYALIKEEMAIPSNLLEHVAGRILRKIKIKYPSIQKTKIKLSKLAPPVGGEVASAAVIMEG